MRAENLIIGGEIISAKGAMALMAMMEHDAKEFAGVFYEQNRTPKFRVNWPVQDVYVAAEWRTFIAAVRAMYSERMGSPKTPPDLAKRLYLAILVERAFAKGMEALGAESDTRLQIAPGTAAFDGDKYDNRKIVENFGVAPNLRAKLRASAAMLQTIH